MLVYRYPYSVYYLYITNIIVHSGDNDWNAKWLYNFTLPTFF